MRAKASFPLAVVLSILGLCATHADEPPIAVDAMPSAPILDGGTEVSMSGPTVLQAPTPMQHPGAGTMQPGPAGTYAPTYGGVAQSAGLTDWILYVKPECCGPVGCDGPIKWELYVRNGPSIPVGGGVLGAVLNTGWMFQGGGRSLFFNPELTAAWAVDIGISYNFNQSVGDRTIFMNFSVPTDIPQQFEDISGQFQLRQFSRTAFNLAVGREYYLFVWPGSGAALRAAHTWAGRWERSKPTGRLCRTRPTCFGPWRSPRIWIWKSPGDVPISFSASVVSGTSSLRPISSNTRTRTICKASIC